ncbi:unnamed protein product [Rotaria sp. Silwood2]|nr:unnamed protein product [Rotaria sp. Silwood2]CAF4029135.1 unnamed protein product [Rotaria sp. Silwood2]
MNHQILSPYTAFVGVETTSPKNNNTGSQVRHIPIQISKGDEHLFGSQPSFSYSYGGAMGPMGPMGFFSGHHQHAMAAPMPMASARYGYRGPPIRQQAGNSWIGSNMVHYKKSWTTVATTTQFVSTDPVRWLIDQQSFNGAWLLNENDIKKLTNGKSLSTFISNVTKDKDALTTALAIAILELKHADQKNLWYGVVEKGRKRLSGFGLSSDQINLLINEIKNKL